MKFRVPLLTSIAVFILIFVSLCYSASVDISSDLSEHLLIGKIILQTHRFITENMFSYVAPHFPYVDYEWFSEVILYIVMQVTGIPGLILLKTILGIISFFVIYYYAIKKYNFLIVSYIALFILQIWFGRTYLRPEIFSYVFLSGFIVLLYRFREKFSKSIYLLIPLQLLWVNMHIYFLLGIFLVGLFLLEASIFLRKKEDGKYLKTLSLVFAGIILVSCINPYGIKALYYPIMLLQTYQFPVEENANIFAADTPGQIVIPILFLKIFSSLSIIGLFIVRQKARLIDWLLIISFIIICTLAVRNLPLFVFAAFIPLCHIATDMKHILYKITINDKYLFKITHAKYIFFLVLFFMLTIIIGIFEIQSDGFGFASRSSSEDALNFMENNHIKGPILNNYNMGDYTAYRLYPKESVFIDGRPEAYPPEFFTNEYFPTFQTSDGFTLADNKYHFNVMLLSYADLDLVTNGQKGMTFISQIMKNPDWRLVYLDSHAVIFLRNTKENSNVINKYAIAERNFTVPNNATLSSLIPLEYFASTAGWKLGFLKVELSIVKVDPNNCAALHNILTLVNPNSPAVSSYALAYTNKCQRGN